MTRRSLLLAVLFGLVEMEGGAKAGTLPQGYAWGENTGWIEMVRNGVPRAYSSNTFLGGFIWGESVGWIHLGDGTPRNGSRYGNDRADDCGVNVDGHNLSGFAWGENIGWIEFAPAGWPPVILRSDGRLEGFAFSQSAGWVYFLAAEPALTISTNASRRGITNPPEGSYSYSRGSRVRVQAIPREGFRFARWEGEVEDPARATAFVLMNGDKSVRAIFESAGVTIDGRVLTPTGDGVGGADVSLHRASTAEVLASTRSNASGSFSFGSGLSLRAGYYHLTAVSGARTGRTLDFWAASGSTSKNIVIELKPIGSVIYWIDGIHDNLRLIALLENDLLADMSEHIDSYASEYNEAQTALKLANTIWSLYSLVSGVSGSAESVRGLLSGKEIFSSTTKAVGWASTLMTATKQGAWDVPRLMESAPESIDAVRLFLRDHLAEDHGGVAFGGSRHVRTSDDYRQDGAMAFFDREVQEEVRLFNAFLASQAVPEDIPIGRLQWYVVLRERMAMDPSHRGTMDSQIFLLLPEGRGKVDPPVIPITLRPIYLDYFKTIGKLNQLFASKVVALGAKIASHGLVLSGVVTGPAGVALGIGVSVAADVASDWIEGVEADTRAHLVELWGRAGACRIVDFESLADYVSGMRHFIEKEFMDPWYLENRSFRSTIESVEVEFPKWGPFGLLPDTRRVLVTARVRNDGDPADTVILARNYGNEWLTTLFSVLNLVMLPTVLFRDWQNLKINSFTDADIAWSQGRLAKGSNLKANFELLTGVGFLEEILDMQEVLVEVFSGPWNTAAKRVHYNLWWESEGKRKKADEDIGFLLSKRGKVTAGEFEEWKERVVLEATATVRAGAPPWTTSYTVPAEMEEITMSLREEGGAEMHLLVADAGSAERIGFLPEEGREVRELAGTYTGTHGEKEEVTISAAGGRTFSITVALGAPGIEEESHASLVVLARPKRPALLGFEPVEFDIYVRPGEVALVAGRVAEAGGQAGLRGLAVEGMSLGSQTGPSVDAQEPRRIETPYLEPRGEIPFEFKYPMPPDSGGIFEGTVRVVSEETGEKDLLVRVHVDSDEPETEIVLGPLRNPDGRWVLGWQGSDATMLAERLCYETFLEGRDTEWSLAISATEVVLARMHPGDYTFLVRAVDLAGNRDSTPASVAFAVPRQESFVRGEVNQDDSLDIADPIALLSYLFAGEMAPGCLKAADCNDDGQLDIADPIAILNHIFGGAPPLPAPYPDCGADPTGDPLGCDAYAHCR